MSKSNGLKSIIEKLSWDTDDLIIKYENCLTSIETMIQNSEELKEEIQFIDFICQICVVDLKFDFWVKLSNGHFSYHKGVARNPNIKFLLSNEILLDIFQRRITISEVYMKALVKVQGDLKYLICIRNVLNEIFCYIYKT